MTSKETRNLHVGLVGAGLGGLVAAIALRLAGAEVTVLEAAAVLGDIGAGIQMTPNVARLLQKWGVADIIGDNLVEVSELNLRRQDGRKVGYTKMIPNVRQELGHPWWVVHRPHLHEALVKVAQSHGAKLLTNSRITSVNQRTGSPVSVRTEAGKEYSFDLLIGSDGVNSIVRRTIFPDVRPTPPTTNCAFRAIVPYSQILQDPVAKELFEKLTMEVWMAENSYIITYPISGGKDLNLVLSHHLDHRIYQVEDVPLSELRKQYEGYDPRIKRIVDMIPETQRWPLLVTGPLDSWSSPEKNIVLMGDAAHSMVNHMAQGAATAMEDGAFLGRCIAQVVQGRLTLAQAIEVYENERMPKVHLKQEVSFINGAIWHLPAGPAQEARDEVMRPELDGSTLMKSPNLYGDPRMMKEVYGYDAEGHADEAIRNFLEGKRTLKRVDGTDKSFTEVYMKWFLPYEGKEVRNESKL